MAVSLFGGISRRYGVWLFFFSSRRRHTRSLCDWSSDVCSSDLKFARMYLDRSVELFDKAGLFVPRQEVLDSPGYKSNPEIGRSEERRVGKEFKSRWVRYI